jgi:NitT/TauT family transport system substrate-binding protein
MAQNHAASIFCGQVLCKKILLKRCHRRAGHSILRCAEKEMLGEGNIMQRIASLLGAAALLALAGSFAHAADQGAATDHVKVGISRISGYPGVPVGIARGYFQAQGIDVEMVIIDSAQPISVGVASGDLDFGVSGSSVSFFTLAAQGQLRFLASSSREMPGFNGIVAVVGDKAWQAGLKSPQDLPGHDIAVTQIGTALHYSIGLIAEKYGFPMSAVTVRPLQSNPNVISALLGGTVAAAIMPVSPVQPAIDRGDLHELVALNELWHNSSGAVLFTSTKVANERGEMVKRFLVAYRHALKDFHDAFADENDQHRDGPLAPVILPIMADFTHVTVEQFDRTAPFADAQGRLDPTDLDKQIAWFKAQGLMKADLRAADVIDMRYAILYPPQASALQ